MYFGNFIIFVEQMCAGAEFSGGILKRISLWSAHYCYSACLPRVL